MNTIIIGTVVLSLVYDPSGTARLVATTVSVRGMTWIMRKITENVSFDASQIIDFTGWSIAGISMVKIISNAMGSISTVDLFFTNMSMAFEKVANVVDKITFWN